MYAAAIDRFCPHEVRDDLESFFYVSVIIMVTFHEAGKQSPLRNWRRRCWQIIGGTSSTGDHPQSGRSPPSSRTLYGNLA
jgi:hypothetical protein